MSAFLVVAVLLTLIATAIIVLPLVVRRGDAPPAVVAAVTAALALAAGAAVLYPAWSEWNWSEPAITADNPAAMVGRLARRLERNPDDLEGWLTLGRSYAVLEQHPLSARAYQRASSLAEGRNAEALMGLAEALVLSEQSGLDGRAGRLFEQALEIDATSTKALFYSAIAALERGDAQLSRDRFVRLLDGNPPPEVRRLIEEQVRALDAEVAGVAAAVPAAGSAAAPAAVTGPAAPAVSVPLRITLSPDVADKAAAGAPLFVVARIPGQRGAPLAAQRLDARFPQDVDLLSSDAMLAGTGFTAGQELEIEARVANGGGASSRSGDPFGVATVRAGSGQRVAIEISQIKP